MDARNALLRLIKRLWATSVLVTGVSWAAVAVWCCDAAGSSLASRSASGVLAVLRSLTFSRIFRLVYFLVEKKR